MDQIKKVGAPTYPAVSSRELSPIRNKHCAEAPTKELFDEIEANKYSQRMEALRIEADESSARAEELKAKVKQLEAETTQKEQEITSLSHKNSVLEGEVEKLEGQVKVHKDEAGAGAQAGSQAESLQRKIQVLEEEAEESDRTIRELNEKCVTPCMSICPC